MTTTQDELIAFLTARLDEDEAALAADATDDGGRFLDADDQTVRFVERFADEDRVLREVAAKRAIVDNYRRTATACLNVTGPELDTPGYAEMRGARDAFRAACTSLAVVYIDHPDYRREWRPRDDPR
jgi:hypothetical protein